MRYTILIAIFFCWISCGKDEDKTYPISYTLDHADQSGEGLYLVDPVTGVSTLPVNTGSYGAYRDTFKLEILEAIQTIFDLKEVGLLSADSVRIHFFSDEEEYDTIVTYSSIEGQIMIDELNGGLVTYDKDQDQFIVCAQTTFVIPGPNVSNPGNEYNQFIIQECFPGYSVQDYADSLVLLNDYLPLDTIGVLLTRLIYK